MIIRNEKLYTITVLIKGSNRDPAGKRKNTVNSITLIDTTVEEVTRVIRTALEAEAEKRVSPCDP